MKIFCCDVWGRYSRNGTSEYLETIGDESEEAAKTKALEYIADFEEVSGRIAWIDLEYIVREQ